MHKLILLLVLVSCASGPTKIAAPQSFGAITKPISQKDYKKECDEAVMESCTKLGEMYQKNGNISESVRVWNWACDNLELRACVILGDLKKKQGKRLEAKKYFDKACFHGDKQACKTLKAF
jgi:TPR repeat protein